MWPYYRMYLIQFETLDNVRSLKSELTIKNNQFISSFEIHDDIYKLNICTFFIIQNSTIFYF